MGWSIRQYEVRVATTNKYISGINIIKADLKITWKKIKLKRSREVE
jgi:hypothetical protein